MHNYYGDITVIKLRMFRPASLVLHAFIVNMHNYYGDMTVINLHNTYGELPPNAAKTIIMELPWYKITLKTSFCFIHVPWLVYRELLVVQSQALAVLNQIRKKWLKWVNTLTAAGTTTTFPLMLPSPTSTLTVNACRTSLDSNIRCLSTGSHLARRQSWWRNFESWSW